MNLRGAAHKAPDQEVPTPRMRRSTQKISPNANYVVNAILKECSDVEVVSE